MARIHSSCPSGKKVLVILKDGSRYLGHFKERNNRYCLLKGHKRIPWEKVRSFSIYKEKS